MEGATRERSSYFTPFCTHAVRVITAFNGTVTCCCHCTRLAGLMVENAVFSRIVVCRAISLFFYSHHLIPPLIRQLIHKYYTISSSSAFRAQRHIDIAHSTRSHDIFIHNILVNSINPHDQSLAHSEYPRQHSERPSRREAILFAPKLVNSREFYCLTRV